MSARWVRPDAKLRFTSDSCCLAKGRQLGGRWERAALAGEYMQDALICTSSRWESGTPASSDSPLFGHGCVNEAKMFKAGSLRCRPPQ